MVKGFKMVESNKKFDFRAPPPKEKGEIFEKNANNSCKPAVSRRAVASGILADVAVDIRGIKYFFKK
ncbi:MAG TPA: hypothetical protein VK815_00910 [Candidatus Acidoferrales bacterium]|jgi:hypothetical protein|nr:hypothetical protein [Candidatus Acidoferrales bacterium]